MSLRNPDQGTARMPCLRDPIVLVHGLLGFDRVKIGPVTFARYFPVVEDSMAAVGNSVFVPNLSKTGGVERRATELKRAINQRFPNQGVHIVAHSMGGLDARYMISKLDMHDRVRSLTTLGTPHRGSAFADWALRNFGRFLYPVLGFCGIPTEAFRDLTTEACARFNEAVPDVPDVRYYSVSARCPRRLIKPYWKAAYDVVSRVEGENDGVVSVRSARYGRRHDTWFSDHMGLVNRKNPRARWTDRTPLYADILRRLADPSEQTR